MDITVCRPEDLTAADRTAWEALQRESAQTHGAQYANPFLGPEFTRTLARHTSGVRVAVIREAGEPVAFLPHQRSAGGVGRAVGLGLSDCQGMIARPGLRWNSRDILRECGLVVFEFDHLVDGQSTFEEGVTGRFNSPVMDVDKGYEEYLGRLRQNSPKFTKTTLAKRRSLERKHGQLRYEHDERDLSALQQLMEWKSAQYRRTGRNDRFSKPWIVEFVKDLFDVRTDRFAGLLSVLYVADRPVAAHFGLRSPDVLACWFPAYDPEYSKFSPGLILHLNMAEGAAADGVVFLDLGRGEKEYKESLKTRDLTVSEGWVTRRHPVALGYQMARGPVRALRNTVNARPELREPADRLLKRLGRLRAGRSA